MPITKKKAVNPFYESDVLQLTEVYLDEIPDEGEEVELVDADDGNIVRLYKYSKKKWVFVREFKRDNEEEDNGEESGKSDATEESNTTTDPKPNTKQEKAVEKKGRKAKAAVEEDKSDADITKEEVKKAVVKKERITKAVNVNALSDVLSALNEGNVDDAKVMIQKIIDANVSGKKKAKVDGEKEKKTRKPSEYNLFIRDELLRLKNDEPTISHRERMALAVKNWKEMKGTA